MNTRAYSKWRRELTTALRRLGLSDAEISGMSVRLWGTEQDVTNQRLHQVWGAVMAKLNALAAQIDAKANTDAAASHVSSIRQRIGDVRAMIDALESEVVLVAHAVGAEVSKSSPDTVVTERMVPARVYNRLGDLGVKVLGDFSKISRRQLLNTPRLGVCSVNQLECMLARHGIVLKE